MTLAEVALHRPVTIVVAVVAVLFAAVLAVQELLRYGLVLYDALYAWCGTLQHEKHGWPPADYRAAS